MRWKMIFITIVVFALSGVIFGAIPMFQPHAIGLAAATSLSVGLFVLGWSLRRYIYFSLSGLMLALLTLQIPVMLVINPWKVEWLPGLGGVLFLLWLCGVYIYAIDRGLSRYVRERSLDRLKADETKGIGKR